MADLFDDMMKHAHRVESQSGALARDMIRELNDSKALIIGRLADLQEKYLKGEDFGDASYKKRRAVLKAQQAEVERVLGKVYKQAGQLTQEAAAEVMAATSEATAAAMTTHYGLKVGLGKLSTKAVKAWFESSTVDGLLFADWSKKLERASVDRIVSAGRQAMIQGWGVQKAARYLKQKGVEASVPGLRGLATTFMHSAAGHAREEFYKKMEAEDIIVAYRRSGVLDGRTCLRCGPDDGQVVKAGQSRITLPEHFRCRCMWLPIVDMKNAKPGKRATVKHSERWVNHRDGSRSREFTPDDIGFFTGTYNEWMKRQLGDDPAFVKKVLGQKRFGLFKAGKLTLKQMSSHA